MGGWQLILCGAVMAAGTLLYLRLVAHEIELVERDLGNFEIAQRRSYQRWLEFSGGDQADEDIPTAPSF